VAAGASVAAGALVAAGAFVAAGGRVAAGELAAGAGDEQAVSVTASSNAAISTGAVRRGIAPDL